MQGNPQRRSIAHQKGFIQYRTPIADRSHGLLHRPEFGQLLAGPAVFGQDRQRSKLLLGTHLCSCLKIA